MSQRTRMRAFLLAGSSAAILTLTAGMAHAQRADGDKASTVVDEVVVTAQHKEETLQSVPISISAFSAEALAAQKIEGGPDLVKGIPNVSFTKTNFSGYNFTIRGIGTQAVSVTTDPGVSVNYNSTALIRNRLFEQEFFDVERVEVLRGPQGTLYGRNATAGAVNIITAKPTDRFEGDIKGEVGNYNSRRLVGFLNVPLLDDKLALRVAGASTQRDGFAFNETTGNHIDGRDLYSTRVTLGFRPNDKFHGALIWEHFNEDDNRARSTKQLCTRDPGPSSLGAVQNLGLLASAFMSQGCKNASLYDKSAYGTPNGLSIPFVLAAAQASTIIGNNSSGGVPLLQTVDPYGGKMQSDDLRRIASQFDPRYKAKTDVIELNFDVDVATNLTLTSQTAYSEDHYFATQDYNRFNTVSNVFNDSTGLTGTFGGPGINITPGGVYCDPQLGCSSSIVGMDRSQAKSKQFSQEFRLQSAYDGAFNFSLGANYTRYKTREDYYVFFNILSAISQASGIGNNSGDITKCNHVFGAPPTTVTPTSNTGCIYIDPNKLNQIDGKGHNYFRSINPYRLQSSAIFGEAYVALAPNVRLTAGLRYTDDRKTFTPTPTQLLLSSYTGGTVDGGYPEGAEIKQKWGVVTGRLGVDWTPELSFTDKTLVYAFYNRGYKGGGANPPSVGFGDEPAFPGGPPIVSLTSYPATFKPEYVNAFEIGTKNSLLGGALILNGAAFYYDYSGYQVSQIQDRTTVNENFDAKIWGAELESVWQATPNLRFNANLGYQHSELASGSKSIDVMDRTQGNPDYTIVKPIANVPSNCVVSKKFMEMLLQMNRDFGQPDDAGLNQACPGSAFSYYNFGLMTDADLPNGGRGFYADVSGNSLPNAPKWTQALGAEYTHDFGPEWKATIRGDVYHQSQSWARVYEDAVDKLHGWYNVNLRLTVSKPEAGLEFEAYVKNLLDDTPITGAFVNSDDTALTTNVFVLDPRLIGVSVRKTF